MLINPKKKNTKLVSLVNGQNTTLVTSLRSILIKKLFILNEKYTACDICNHIYIKYAFFKMMSIYLIFIQCPLVRKVLK